jgi:hypothetical protein
VIDEEMHEYAEWRRANPWLDEPDEDGFTPRETLAPRAAAPKLVLPPHNPKKAREWFLLTTEEELVPREEVIECIGPTGSVGTLTAPSGTGKSFLLYPLMAAVGNGSSFFGLRTQRGSVVYIPFEGDDVTLRGRAYTQATGQSMENVFIVRGEGGLNSKEGIPTAEAAMLKGALQSIAAWLAEAGQPPIHLIIIDTARASLNGDENSSETVSAYLKVVRTIQREVAPKSFLLFTHHTGWQDGEHKKPRERGSSDFRGNVDTAMYLQGNPMKPECLTLMFNKVRDGKKPADVALYRESVTLATLDHWGDPQTSCVVISRGKSSQPAADVDVDDANWEESLLKMLKTINSNKITTQEHLCKLTTFVKRAIRSLLADAEAFGYIYPPVKQKPYQLTPEGLERLGE